MAIFTTIIVILFIVLLIKSTNKNEDVPVINQRTIGIDWDTARLIDDLQKDKRKAENIDEDGIDMALYQSNIGINSMDYSELTPAEAARELKQRKNFGEYIPSYEYFGYMDRINSKYDDKFLDQLDNLTPEKAIEWFKKKRMNAAKMSSNIWLAVESKVAPYHEPILLELLQKVTPVRVDGWVNARKREGYFFSQIVFDTALAKRRLYKPKQRKDSPDTH